MSFKVYLELAFFPVMVFVVSVRKDELSASQYYLGSNFPTEKPKSFETLIYACLHLQEETTL